MKAAQWLLDGTRRIRFFCVLLIAMLPSIPGCDALDECPTAVRITVTVDTSPQFNWEPACEVSWLWVWDFESGERFWTLEGSFEPPVIYGVEPEGAETESQPQSLMPGRIYRIAVLGSGLYGLETQGRLDFTVD